MIEIEKKFVIDNNKKNQFVSEAEFLYKKVFTDTYYDNDDFSLTSKDIWLRSRDNNFELKIPVSISDKGFINQYKELTDENLIKKHLNLQGSLPIKQLLVDNKYNQFCILTTTRERFKKGSFSIDIDTVTADSFNYSIAEVELMVEKESDMESALKQITSFMEQNNISESAVRGKVIEYLRQKNPNHYNALLSAGIIKQ
jgi:thiamine-triphosphatase